MNKLKSAGGFPLLLIPFYLFITSCAIQVAPSGGERDIKPPKVLKQIPENYSTNFNRHDIAISFDEYIQLKDLNSQLIVSPPLKYPVDAKVKNKMLLIHLEDTLQPNSTYTMNFGNAITDNHEGNAIENFQYIFSTGDVIDSLEVSGRIENAFDKKTEKGIYVMLYRNNVDSLPQKSLPDYFAKTDDAGQFKIRNVSAGDYKIIALKDNNSNYLFDNIEEPVAFGDVPVHAGDSAIVLKIFKEFSKQQLLKSYSEEAGKVVVVYSRPLNNERISFLSDTSVLKIYSTQLSAKRDTVTIWYRNQVADSLVLVMDNDSKKDTVSIRLKKTTDKVRFKYVPVLQPQYVSKIENPLDPGKPLLLIFNHPVENFELKNISLKEDSMKIMNAKIAFIDSMNQILQIDYKWKEDKKYVVDIPAQTMTDIFGIKNDTLQLIFKTKPLTEYGTMALKIKPAEKNVQYVVQLIDDKETVYRQSIIHGDAELNYNYLDPKVYGIKLIKDSNENASWDTGNYLNHLQPEEIYYYKENITVRANWDVDIKWNVE